MEPVKLLERAAGSAAHAVRHPISSAAYAAGLARGLAGAALHGATVTEHAPTAGPRPVATQREAPTWRAPAHGRASDAEIDAWIDEAMARGQEAEDLRAEPDPE